MSKRSRFWYELKLSAALVHANSIRLTNECISPFTESQQCMLMQFRDTLTSTPPPFIIATKLKS